MILRLLYIGIIPTYMKTSQEISPKLTEKFLKKICLDTKILILHITHVRKYKHTGTIGCPKSSTSGHLPFFVCTKYLYRTRWKRLIVIERKLTTHSIEPPKSNGAGLTGHPVCENCEIICDPVERRLSLSFSIISPWLLLTGCFHVTSVEDMSHK